MLTVEDHDPINDPITLYESLEGPREVRTLGMASGGRSHYPTCRDELLSILEHAQEHGRSVFYVTNPTHSIATKYGKPSATKDEHVLKRSLILVDIDSAKIPGVIDWDEQLFLRLRNSEPTFHAVHQHIKNVLRLDTHYTAVSGSGRCIMVRADMPAHEASETKVKQFLFGLAQQFNCDHAQIDTSVWNASRLTRLIGTTNYKPGGEAPSYFLGEICPPTTHKLSVYKQNCQALQFLLSQR